MNISKHDNNTLMSTQVTPSVEDAKRILRQARLNQHKTNIRKALDSNRDEDLANASSGFVALFRNKAKGKPKSK